MPAKRLPWYKVWAEHTDHEKICGLSDGEYRTWHMVLAKAAHQPIRWRFASVKHAATVTSRSERHIRSLVAADLMDLRDDGLWVHDWNMWQRWTPEDDANDSRTAHERHGNDTGTTREAPSRPLERGDRSPNGLLREEERERDSLRSAQSDRPTKVEFDEGTAAYYALDKGFDAEQIERMTAKFLDHHAAGGWKRTGGVVIKDRMAAWRTWVANELERNPPTAPEPVGHVIDNSLPDIPEYTEWLRNRDAAARVS